MKLNGATVAVISYLAHNDVGHCVAMVDAVEVC